MIELNCRETVEVLMDYVEGKLSSEYRAAVEEHLAQCPPCVGFLNAYRATPSVLRRLTNVALPLDVQFRLRAHIDRHLRP